MSAQPPLPEPETWVEPVAPVEPSAPATAAVPGAGGPGRRRIGLIAGGAVLLVAIAAATSLAASPAPSTTPNTTNGGGPGTGGDRGKPDFAGRPFPNLRGGGEIGLRDVTITSISGDQVTLGTEDGWRRTITVGGSVTITKGGQSIAAADLKVGDQVRFRQTRNDDGTYTVTDLAVVVPTIRGQVSNVTSSGFKLTTRDGSVWTITTDGSTKVRVGKADGSLSDLKDGDTVHVAGNTTGDNAMTALVVGIAPARAFGTVTAKTADSITIKQRDGKSLVIHVTGTTTFWVPGKQDAKLSDVTVGMALGAAGRSRADGSLDATQVGAASADLFQRGAGDGNGKGRANGLFKQFAVPGFDFRGLPDPADDGGDAPAA